MKLFNKGKAGKGLDIEKHLPWHGPEMKHDSWFVVANLVDEDGARVGYHVHVNLKVLEGGDSQISTSIAVVNQETGFYKLQEFMTPTAEARLGEESFSIEFGDFSWKGDVNGQVLHAVIDGAEIECTCERTAHPIIPNGDGKFPFLGEEQYDFALPAMQTSGTVQMDGKTHVIASGVSWLDRQWGGNPKMFASDKPITKMKWTWANPQLSNGVNMTFGDIYLLKPIKKKALSVAEVSLPDGSVVHSKLDLDYADYWKSPETGYKYPCELQAKLPTVDAELKIVVTPKNQEIITALESGHKFEGTADITGTYAGEPVTGVCYVELVGYWH